MEEKRELVEKSGVTFKELFIVFKRLWVVMLAVVVIVTAGITFIANKKTAQTYCASVQLRVRANNPDTASDLAEQFMSLINVRDFTDDVSNGRRADTTGSDGNVYVSEEIFDDYVKFEGSGRISAYASDNTVYFNVTYTSTYNETVARYTLQQIVYSLNNVANMSDDDGFVSPYLAGKLVYEQGISKISTWTPEKNTKRQTLIGVILGVLLDALIVFLVYKFDDTVKTKEELERITGALFITYIEDIEEEKGGHR